LALIPGGGGVPVPPAIKPFIEAMTNFSLSNMRQLEGNFQQSLPTGQRVNSSTSEFAKLVGDEYGVSPIKVDNFLSSWFGMTGALVSMTGDALMNPNRADLPIHKLPFANLVMHDPEAKGALADSFYDLAGRARMAVAEDNDMKKFNPEKRAEFYADDENRKLIGIAPAMNKLMKRESELRTELKRILASPNLDGAEKAERKRNYERAMKQIMANADHLQYIVSH